MKNLLSIFVLLILLVSIFLTKAYYDAAMLHTTFSQVFLFQEKLTNQLIDNYFSTDERLKKQAEKSIKRIVLKDLEYSNWLNYIDYIEISIYPIKIQNISKEELIIALNLSQDEGIMVIYKHQDVGYIYSNKIEDLTFIKDVKRIKNPLNNRIFLIVEELLDESIGAYFIDNFIRVFTLIDGKYNEVYRQSLDYNAYYYEKWTDPSIENPKWLKLNEKAILDYIITTEGKNTINTSKNISKYKSNSTQLDTIPQDFILVTEKSFDITSIWSEDYKYFIQGTAKIKHSNETVGIMEISEQAADSLLSLSNKYYKVIDRNGKINYMAEDNLEIIDMY